MWINHKLHKDFKDAVMPYTMLGSSYTTPKEAKKPLPHGWVVLPSKTYPDRVYYYNTISKCSTWVNPCRDYLEASESSPEKDGRVRNNKRKYEESFKPVVPKSAFAGDDDGSSYKPTVPHSASSKEDDDNSMLVDDIEDYDEDHNDYFDNVPMNNFSLRRTENVLKDTEVRSPQEPTSPVTFFSSNLKQDPPVSKVIPNEEPKDLWAHLRKSTQKIDVPKPKRSLVLSDLGSMSSKTKSETNVQVQSPTEKKVIRSRVLDSIKQKSPKPLLRIYDDSKNSAEKSSQMKRSPMKFSDSNHNLSYGNKNSANSRLQRIPKIPRIQEKLGSDGCHLTNSSPLSDVYSNDNKTPAQNRLARARGKMVEAMVKAFEKKKSPKSPLLDAGKIIKKNKAPKKLTLDQLSDKKKESIGKRFQRLREKALEEAKEILVSNSFLSEAEKSINKSPKKKVLFVGETTNEFFQSEPINVTQYVDQFPEEEMEWEPSDEQEMIKHINKIRQTLAKETEISDQVYLPHQNIEKNNNIETSWIVVVDTNILLSSLSFIKELRDTKINNLGYPVIYIPWRVVQELDHLKDSPGLKVGARRAINYINENLIAGHPRLHGQSFKEFNAMSKSESESPDDDILQTCIDLQEKEVDKKLILLTNDKNFESKAILCGIKTFSKERFTKEVNLSDYRSNTSISCNHVNNLTVEESDKLLCEVKEIIKKILIYVVETELKLAYGDDWKLMVKNKHWTLPDLISSFIKYWMSIFGMVFPKDVLNEMENLKKIFKKTVIAGQDEVKEVIQTSQQLLASMKRCKELRPYMECIDRGLEDINLLSKVPEATSTQCDNVTPSVNGTGPFNETVQIKQERFDYCDSSVFYDSQIHVDKIKHVFKQIWNYVKDVVLIIQEIMSPQSPDSNKQPVDQSTFEDIKNKLPDICKSLEELVAAIEEVTMLHLTEIVPTNPAVANLSKLLFKLAMNMNVSFLELMPVESLPVSISVFCKEAAERELLHRSLYDFNEFRIELISGMKYFQTAT